MNITSPHQAAELIKKRAGKFSPQLALVLGSGLNKLADMLNNPIVIPYSEIPGFSDTSVAGHQGNLILGLLNGVPIACLQGRSHSYEGKNSAAISTPIRTLKLLGCESIILTNAAASLRKEVTPGNLVLISDHINFQFQNPLVGANDDSFGPRFPSLQNAYDSEFMEIASQTASELNINISTGVYLATLGPCYETPAEIRAFKIMGADMVGMSTVPEVIIARHCNMKVLAISTITNMAVGMSDEFLTHENVLRVAKMAAEDLSQLIIALINKITVSNRQVDSDVCT
ncbi:MAG: purine-nucleoside phosphorylase [Gammaproteobacteria bacterium]|nr:purine-nucleoside phosphorylase [Gammaproteobacteria bacterium]